MYVDYFGLKARLFKPTPTGTEVFVGPQTVKLIKGLQTAFVGHDSIAIVSGAPGLGKSTLVAKALESFATNLMPLRIPRAKLAHDEVLEFLLENLGASDAPTGTLRRVIACREAVSNCAKEGRPLCVIVEDADRIGIDALIELEALTAADGDDNLGAHLVLLGDQALLKLLTDADCSRIAQRTRLRFPVAAMQPEELRGYLRHSFRAAGAPIENILADDACDMLYELSAGVPKSCNNFIEGLLEAAAERKLKPVTRAFVREVAVEQYGFDLAEEPVESNTITAETLALTDEAIADIERDISATQPSKILPLPSSNGSLPDIDELTAAVAASALPEAAEEGGTETDIPTLFSSARITSPAIATPASADAEGAAETASEPVAPPAPEPVAEPAPQVTQDAVATADHQVAEEPAAAPVEPLLQSEPEHVPSLETAASTQADPMEPSQAATLTATDGPTETQAEPSSEAELAIELEPTGEVLDEPLEPAQETQQADATAPEWERDPTLAELRPDMEALEQAMAESYESEAQAPPPVVEPDPVIELKDPTMIDMPEITLDVAIQQKIEEATEALQKHDATIAEEEIEDAPKPLNSAKPEALNKDIMDGISNARSLEDVDDKMAETLFGAEFAELAAEAVANRPTASAPDSELSLEEPVLLEPELELLESEPQTVAATNDASASKPDVETDMEREFREVYGDDALEVSLQSDAPPRGLDLSASQRLATVRALNANKGAAASSSAHKNAAGTQQPAPPPQPIEEQISTSITQTLRTLSARQGPANDDDDDEHEERKTGFFSRFKRS